MERVLELPCCVVPRGSFVLQPQHPLVFLTSPDSHTSVAKANTGCSGVPTSLMQFLELHVVCVRVNVTVLLDLSSFEGDPSCYATHLVERGSLKEHE
jgi:hypothetical protein